MAKKVYEEAEVAAVASTIRDITGGTTTYKLREMPEGVKAASVAISNNLISGKATAIVIPQGCTKIRSYAFYYAKNIKAVSVECTRLDGVYFAAFAFCSALEEFKIATKCNIRRFGEKAFVDCSKLKVVDLSKYSGSDIPKLDNYNAFDGVHADCKIIVPAKLYAQWKASDNWAYIANRIVAAE